MPSPGCVAAGSPGEINVITAGIDQTATAETVHGTLTIPAASCQIGTTFRLRLWGNVDNGTTGITFTPRIRWGGVGGTVLLAVPTFTASTTANTNRAWEAESLVTVRTTGGTGSAVATLTYLERSTSTTGIETIHSDNSGATAVTISTSTSNDLVFTWVLSATTWTPHMRTLGGFTEMVRA